MAHHYFHHYTATELLLSIIPPLPPSAHFNGPPIISPPSNIFSTVLPSPHRSCLQSHGCSVIPWLCGIPFRAPSIHVLLKNPLGALTCMFMTLGARRGLRGAVLLAGMVQCGTVHVGVLHVRGGGWELSLRLWARRGQGRGFVESSLKMAW